MDSGASSHMTPKREYFSKYQVFSTPEKVALGDGRVVEAVGVGTVWLTMLFKVSNSKNTVMHDVLHVQKLSYYCRWIIGAYRDGVKRKGD